MTKDEKIAKLGKVITDRATVLLGKDKITPDSPEYLGINSALKFTAVKYDEKMADDMGVSLGALGAFAVTFVIYFWNLDMKLTSVMEGILLKHYDKIDRDQHL